MAESRMVSFGELWTILSLVVGVLSGVGYLVMRDVDHRIESLQGNVASIRDDCRKSDEGVLGLLRAEYQGTTQAVMAQLQSNREKIAEFQGFMESEIAMHADCAQQRADTALSIRDLSNKLNEHERAIQRLGKGKTGSGNGG